MLAFFLPHAALLVAMIFWSSSFIAFKISLTAYSPWEVMAGRMLVASLICLPLWPHVRAGLSNKNLRNILILSVVSEPCLYFIFEANALLYTSAGQAGMVISVMPLMVAIGAAVVFKEKVGLWCWMGFFIAIGGVLWLTLTSVSTESAPNPVLGNFLEGLAMLCAMAYTLCVKHLSDTIKPMALTAAMSFSGALFFIPFALLPLPYTPIILENIPSWMPLAAIVYLGAVVTILGYGMYNLGVSQLPASQAAAYTNLIPVITMIMGIVWLDEVITGWQYVAAGLILFGILLSQKRSPAFAVAATKTKA